MLNMFTHTLHLNGGVGTLRRICELTFKSTELDCEQSLFFFRFNEGSARARESRAAKQRDAKTRAAAQEDFSVLCLSRFAPPVTRVVIVVSLQIMLRAANSIYSPHFAVWPAKRSVLEKTVSHLTACSDNNGKLHDLASRRRNALNAQLNAPTSGETRKRGRQPEKISLFCAFPVSRLQSRAWSFVCLARMFCSTDQQKRETARSLFKSLQNEQCLVLHLHFS